MRKIVHALHQPTADTEGNKEHNSRRQQDDVVARGQVQVVGDNRAAQDQQQTDSRSNHPGAAV